MQPTPLYLGAGLTRRVLPRRRPADAAFDEYISDPAKPVPFRPRPIQPIGYDHGLTWPQWLVDDQREASGRPDVVAFVVRRADRAGQDQRPAGRQPDRVDQRHGRRLGRQADRRLSRRSGGAAGARRLPADGVGRHLPRPLSRELRDVPSRSRPDQPLPYRFALPTANHVFLPGHRIMVQVQSSWFPLYDRNPQTFVPSIFRATPADYREGDAAHLSRAGPGELRRAAAR